MTTPICTFFDSSTKHFFVGREIVAAFINGHPGWRSPKTIDAAARKWAKNEGGCLVMLADDSLAVYTAMAPRYGDHTVKVTKKTFKPGSWAWDNSPRYFAAL
jgi:hypothetical protein